MKAKAIVKTSSKFVLDPEASSVFFESLLSEYNRLQYASCSSKAVAFQLSYKTRQSQFWCKVTVLGTVRADSM